MHEGVIARRKKHVPMQEQSICSYKRRVQMQARLQSYASHALQSKSQLRQLGEACHAAQQATEVVKIAPSIYKDLNSLARGYCEQRIRRVRTYREATARPNCPTWGRWGCGSRLTGPQASTTVVSAAPGLWKS